MIITLQPPSDLESNALRTGGLSGLAGPSESSGWQREVQAASTSLFFTAIEPTNGSAFFRFVCPGEKRWRSIGLAMKIGVTMGWFFLAPILSAQIVQYPAPDSMPRNDDFSVKVRAPGGAWQELSVCGVKVARVAAARFTPEDSAFAGFDFSGTVEVSVTYNKGTIQSARIRPLDCGITPELTSNAISFSLSQARNLSVEVNGDIFHNLQIFASPMETNRPDLADTNVLYYAAGTHEVGTVNVPSGKTVYIAGGALVQGQFLVSHVENVRILGRGILYQRATPAAGARRSRHDALTVEFSKNVEINGLVVVPNSYTVLVGSSENVAIRNLKSFSAGGNNDGIDVFCSTNVLIDGVFMRNSDDCIAIYGHRWSYYGDVTNVTVQNSTLWADVAHPILVGTHGDTPYPDTLESLKFLNLDILDQAEAQIGYQGCLALNAGDGNLIRNVRFENIRVEDFREGQLVNLRVFYNRKYNTSPGRGIENIYFKDIFYHGQRASHSVIAGYDDVRSINNVVFENLQVNGRVIADDMPGKPGFYQTGDMAGFFVGEHVNGLKFITAGAPAANPPPSSTPIKQGQ